MNKAMISILRVLDGTSQITGSREVSRQLRAHGIELTERTVRYHMRILDERGYTEVIGKEGRRITEKGRIETKKSNVSDRIGFVGAKIESLSCLTTLDIETMKGTVVLNVSFISEGELIKAINILKEFFSSPFVISDRMVIAPSGRQIGSIKVPEGKIGLGTVCSVTINGLFLKAGIPVTSRYGGVLEVSCTVPERFTSLISYEGSSLDPLEVFIRSSMTDVTGSIRNGIGSILASFREIPAVCCDEAADLSGRMSENGIGGVIKIGRPNSPFFDVPVGIDRAGMLVIGGLNPVAILDEAGIVTESRAMSSLIEYERMKTFNEIAMEIL